MFLFLLALIDTDNKKLYEEFERDAIPHMDSLYNFAFKMTGDSDDTNDLIQETYLKAFRSWDKFEKGANCKAWLFQILKNTYINTYRKQTKEPDKVDYEEIEADFGLAVDNKIQSLVENLVKEKATLHQTPAIVRQKILSGIKPKDTYEEKNPSWLSGLFEKPAFSFATAIVIVLAIVLIIFNRPGTNEPKNFAIEQLGTDNMFIQAKNNFNSIVEGKLSPQLTSNNPIEIKQFFNSSGVKYSTLVPSFPKLNLLGAVVSEDKGEKFAHHFYTTEKGDLIYLFQVDENHLYSHEIIKLSDDLIKYLDDGNCYTSASEGSITILTKAKKNICVIVSNANLKDLEKNFCNLN